MNQCLLETPLFAHQEQAAEFILDNQGIGALFMDMGTGKTRVALEVFKRLREAHPYIKMIVIAPLSLLDAAWGEDIKKFTDFTYFNAHDNILLDSPIKQDILVINFEAAIQKKNWFLTHHIKDNFLVIDESSRMKSHNSKTTKTILNFRCLPKYKIIMSGTPAPNSPVEYWAQMEFLMDEILHPSFFAFRNIYFHLQRGQQVMELHGQMITRELMRNIMTKGWKYEISSMSFKKLMDRINPLIFWAKKEDCLTLPDQVDEIRQVELGVKQRLHYKDMKNELITFIKEQAVTAQIALAKIMKLREITSGFAFNTKGEEVDIEECPKLTELEEVIEEAGNRQIIIWACFKWDINRICSFLAEKYGAGCARTLYSGTKDHLAAIEDFKSGKARFLVAHPRSAAHGLTFVNCNLQVFFSLDYSYETYEQAKARTHRAGQVNKCTYVHLVAKETIDEQILKILREKGDINEIAYQMMR